MNLNRISRINIDDSAIPPATPGPYVPNHLVWAILSTLFCCLPLGIVSIVFAAQVDGKRAAGDLAGAQEASRRYFGKDAARLTPAESARLAAVLPSPRRYSAAKPGPYVQRRAKRIQRQVVQIGGTAYLEALR